MICDELGVNGMEKIFIKYKLLLSRGLEWIEDILLYEVKKKFYYLSN